MIALHYIQISSWNKNKTFLSSHFIFTFFIKMKRQKQRFFFSLFPLLVKLVAAERKKEKEKKMLWITLIFAIQLKRDHPVVIFTWLCGYFTTNQDGSALNFVAKVLLWINDVESYSKLNFQSSWIHYEKKSKQKQNKK